MSLEVIVMAMMRKLSIHSIYEHETREEIKMQWENNSVNGYLSYDIIEMVSQ